MILNLFVTYNENLTLNLRELEQHREDTDTPSAAVKYPRVSDINIFKYLLQKGLNC